MKHTIAWCLRLKTGLRLEKIRAGRSDGYFFKSAQALEAFSRVRGLADWELSTAYYAMYLAGMALLAKVGVSSKNHRCTLAFLSLLLSKEDLELLEKGKENREMSQYFVEKGVLSQDAQRVIEDAPVLYFKCRKIAGQMDDQRVEELSARLSASLQQPS